MPVVRRALADQRRYSRLVVSPGGSIVLWIRFGVRKANFFGARTRIQREFFVDLER